MSGFAFGPLAGEEASTLGRLTILQARMNPDLAMGDELLKKTGSGNLFMVFGEPDIEIKPTADGQLTLEIHGLDVYDPTTGASVPESLKRQDRTEGHQPLRRRSHEGVGCLGVHDSHAA